MRFYEYEAKALFARHGAPLLRGRLAHTAAEAKTIAAEIGGAVVLKSQVLTGGRMKAGGVKFADTPEQAETAATAILELEINGQKPRGVLVEQRAGVAQEYFAAVTWDGRRKLPVLVFSDLGGIDIEEVAETHPAHVAQVHLSTLLPFSPFKAKEAVAAVGVAGEDLTRLTPIVASLVEVFLRYDLTLAEINPLGKTTDGRFLVLDGHVELEAEARGKHAKLLTELGIGKEETRQARPPTRFEIRGAEVDAADHRGVARNAVECDGDVGLVVRAGGGSLTVFDANRKHGAPRRREDAIRLMSILIHRDTTCIVQGITGREAVNLTRECLDYGSKIVGGVTPGRAGRDVYGVPVHDCVRDITATTHVDGSVVTVPPRFTRDAVFEAIEAGVKLLVI